MIENEVGKWEAWGRLWRTIGALHRRVHVVRTVHALPFAAVGVLAARPGELRGRELLLGALAIVFGRGYLVSMNRWFGAPEDVANPEVEADLPPSEPTPRVIWLTFAIHAGAMLVFLAWMLKPLAGWIATGVVVLLTVAAGVRARTGLGHALVGLGLALTPLAAWAVMRGSDAAPLAGVLVFAGGVLGWATGLDMVYSLTPRLRRLGEPGAFVKAPILPLLQVRWLGRSLQWIGVGLVGVAGPAMGFGATWYVGVALAGLVVLGAHRLQRAPDASDAGRGFLYANLLFGPALLVGAWLAK